MSAYGLAIFLLLIAVVAIAAPVLYLLKSAALMLMMVMAVPLTAVLMISDYVSYRRVFHREERLDAPGGTL